MSHKRHHKFNLGKALAPVTKPLFHEAKEIMNTPKEVLDKGMDIVQTNFLPLLIVGGGIVAIIVLRR